MKILNFKRDSRKYISEVIQHSNTRPELIQLGFSAFFYVSMHFCEVFYMVEIFIIKIQTYLVFIHLVFKTKCLIKSVQDDISAKTDPI